MEKSKTRTPLFLLEKVRQAQLQLMGNRPKRRTSKQVIFDKRWKPVSELPQYLALFFIIYQKDIISAGLKWKDFIVDVIHKREQGETVYDSLYIPDNHL